MATNPSSTTGLSPVPTGGISDDSMSWTRWFFDIYAYLGNNSNSSLVYYNQTASSANYQPAQGTRTILIEAAASVSSTIYLPPTPSNGALFTVATYTPGGGSFSINVTTYSGYSIKGSTGVGTYQFYSGNNSWYRI